MSGNSCENFRGSETKPKLALNTFGTSIETWYVPRGRSYTSNTPSASVTAVVDGPLPYVSVTVTPNNGRLGSPDGITSPEMRVRSADAGRARRNRRSSEAESGSFEYSGLSHSILYPSSHSCFLLSRGTKTRVICC